MLTTFVHHIRQAAIAAGVNWENDCTAELESDRDELQRRIERIEATVARLLTAVPSAGERAK